jgi:hypothetical protein
MSEQTGRKHSGIVSNQQVARPQQPRKIAENTIFKAVRRTHQVEQAGGGSIRQGFLGNQFGRKREIEVGDQHGPIIEAAGVPDARGMNGTEFRLSNPWPTGGG